MTVKQKTVQEGHTSLFLRVSMIGRQKTLSGDVIETVQGEDGDTEGKIERTKLRVQKDYIRKEFLAGIGALDSEFRTRYNLRTKPGLQPGARRPRKNLQQALDLVDDYVARRRKLAEAFADRIDEIKAAAKADLKHLYDEDDYPRTREDILARFDVGMLVLNSVVPAGLPADLKAKLEAEMARRLEEADLKGQQEKRDQFLKGVQTLFQELQPGGRIYDSVIEGIKLYAAEFDPSDDPDIAPLVTKVFEVLKNKSAADLKNFKGDKEEVKALLGDVLPQVEKLGRLINL